MAGAGSMRSTIILLATVLLAAPMDSAQGQNSRGAGAGSRGSGAWVQNTQQQIRGHAAGGPVRRASPRPVIHGRFVHRRMFFVGAPGWAIAFAPAPFIYRIAPPGYLYPYRYYYLGPPGYIILNGTNYSPWDAFSPAAPYAETKQPATAEESSGDVHGRGPGRIAPFDPTPLEVVERMLALASVNSSDRLYDLGSGDGRVVIAAAKRFGARAVGLETDPGLVKLARENARREGVEQLVEFRQQDVLSADLSDAMVVTLYLSNDGNLAVRPHLQQQLPPGARIVSYTFDMGDWAPKITESYRDGDGNVHLLYFWQIGAR